MWPRFVQSPLDSERAAGTGIMPPRSQLKPAATAGVTPPADRQSQLWIAASMGFRVLGPLTTGRLGGGAAGWPVCLRESGLTYGVARLIFSFIYYYYSNNTAITVCNNTVILIILIVIPGSRHMSPIISPVSIHSTVFICL